MYDYSLFCLFYLFCIYQFLSHFETHESKCVHNKSSCKHDLNTSEEWWDWFCSELFQHTGNRWFVSGFFQRICLNQGFHVIYRVNCCPSSKPCQTTRKQRTTHRGMPIFLKISNEFLINSKIEWQSQCLTQNGWIHTQKDFLNSMLFVDVHCHSNRPYSMTFVQGNSESCMI